MRLFWLLGLSCGADVEPGPARHPYCVDNGCKSDYVINGSNIVFCGGCKSYPSSLKDFSSFGQPTIVLEDQVSAEKFLKIDQKSVVLQPKKFGQWQEQAAAKKPYEPHTSALAERVMSQCKFSDRSSYGAGAKVANLNHIFFVPIETFIGVDKVELSFGKVYSATASQITPTNLASQVIAWEPRKTLTKAADPTGERAKLRNYIDTVTGSKAFIMIKVDYHKSRTDLSRSINPSVNDAIPTPRAQLAPSLDLLHFTTKGLGRNPLSNVRWLITCDGFFSGLGDADTRKPVEKYRSWQAVNSEMAVAIQRWKNAQLQKLKGVNSPEVNQVTLAKRNLVLSSASTNFHKIFQSEKGFSDQCKQQASRFIQAYTIAGQAQP